MTNLTRFNEFVLSIIIFYIEIEIEMKERERHRKPTWIQGNCPCFETAKARVTAGFICAPEMCPTEYIITVTISPPATDAPSCEMRVESFLLSAAAPQVTNTSKKVEIISATTWEEHKISTPINICFNHFIIFVWSKTRAKEVSTYIWIYYISSVHKYHAYKTNSST